MWYKKYVVMATVWCSSDLPWGSRNVSPWIGVQGFVPKYLTYKPQENLINSQHITTVRHHETKLAKQVV